MEPDNGIAPPLVIAASFTFEPALEAIGFFVRLLDLPLHPRLAPYAQVLPELLNANSLTRTARGGRAVAIRWRDFAGPAGAATDAAQEFISALGAADDGSPTLVIVCPSEVDADGAADEALRQAVVSRSSVKVLDARRIFSDYSVAEPFDSRADRAAHIPYTAEAFAAIGAAIVRWRARALRPPVKLIAVDGDNTLWDGVLGEDGTAGVACGPGRAGLQLRLAEASRSGQIVAILSKNDDEDLAALFSARGDFPLRLDHVLARRVNWRPKPENLKEIAAAFAVGEESILFLDDNPVECAAMRAACPAALTVRAPREGGLPAFLKHLWPLDRPELTAADISRVSSYRVEAERNAAKAAAPTLSQFFAGLDLKVEIETANPSHLPRIAQMTQRTNQFNATLKRCDERDLAARSGSTIHVVSVKDRFDEYGVVGCMRTTDESGALNVDLFMLSCRVLGRGVEHLMGAELGRIAAARGLTEIRFNFVEGPRNQPVRNFLAEIAGGRMAAGVAAIATKDALALRFDPESTTQADYEPEHGPAARATDPRGRDRGAAYERIACDLTTGAAIVKALACESSPRPDITVGFVAPAPGLEAEIARIWEEVLGVAPIGAEDPFRELGGKSLHVVRIHGLLADRLGVRLDLASLFHFGTVALLAGSLNGPSSDRVSLTENRGARMLAARGAMAARAKTARDRVT